MTLGLIEGAADALSSFAKMFSGIYSDRLARRKPLAVVGYLVTASGMASFSLATASWQVFLARVGAWMGRGARTPVRNVLMTEATTPETYGRAFGFERSMDSAGAVIGPLIAWSVLHFTGAPLKSLFVWTLVPGIAAALFIALLVREKPHTPHPRTPLSGSVASLPGAFKSYLAGVSIAGLGDFSNTLLILWATQAWTPRLGMEAAAQRAMLFYVGYNVVYTIACSVAGFLADRLPKHWVLGGGYALAVIPAVALTDVGRFDREIRHRVRSVGHLHGLLGNARERHGGHAATPGAARRGLWSTGHGQRPGRLRVKRARRHALGLLSHGVDEPRGRRKFDRRDDHCAHRPKGADNTRPVMAPRAGE